MKTIRKALYSTANELNNIKNDLNDVDMMTDYDRKFAAAELIIQRRAISKLIANLLNGVAV